MKIVGLVSLLLTLTLAFFKYSELSLWSLGLGIALAVGVFFLMFKPQDSTPVVPPQENPWQARFQELQTTSTQTIDGLNREVQKMEQRLHRAEERCLSYQKLVDVHQEEIDKLKVEHGQMGLQLIEKERKLAELELAKLEPDLFDTEKRQTEVSFRELRKQFEEKSKLLQQTRQQVKKSEEEKEKLAVELSALQQLVSELGSKEESRSDDLFG